MVSFGPYWVAAVVLAVAGIAKLRRPSAVTEALRAVGLPASPTTAIGLGVGELVLAVSVFAVGGPIPGLLTAGAYLAFAAVAARLASLAANPSKPMIGCGCFGRSATPIGPTHVFANVALAAASLTAVLTSDTPSLPAVAADLPALGLAHLLLIAAAAAATVAILTVLPETKAARIPVRVSDPRVHLFGPTIARKPSRPGAAAMSPETMSPETMSPETTSHETNPLGPRS